MGQGLYLNSEHLAPNDEIGEVIKHGTLSIGFIGLLRWNADCFNGYHHGENEDYKLLGEEIIAFMPAKKLIKTIDKYNLNYTLLASTPAEGLAGRFVKMDCSEYGLILCNR